MGDTFLCANTQRLMRNEFHLSRRATKFGRIHATDCGNTCGKLAGAVNEQFLCKLVGAFAHFLYKVVGSGIVHSAICRQCHVPGISRQRLCKQAGREAESATKS